MAKLYECSFVALRIPISINIQWEALTWPIELAEDRYNGMVSATLVHFSRVKFNDIDLLIVEEIHTLVFRWGLRTIQINEKPSRGSDRFRKLCTLQMLEVVHRAPSDVAQRTGEHHWK